MASIGERGESGLRGGGEASGRGGRADAEGESNDGITKGPPLQLTEEEKGVLMECRRNSTARGLLAVAGSTVLLRALIGTGRIPLHVQRWSRIYYTSLGAVSFLAGVRSYRHVCLDKILALDHSVLADQLRQHQRRQQGWTDDHLSLSSPTYTSPTSPPPPPPPPQTQLTPSYTVSSDKPFSSAVVNEEVSGDQPNAFGPPAYSPSPLSSSDPQSSSSRLRGRTFDEIRDENRQRQQQRHYPTSRVGGVREGSGGGKSVNVRRNKYGDIISDE